MIAFDNRQSKLHHPPRVLLHAIPRRKRKRASEGVGEGERGVVVWVVEVLEGGVMEQES